MWFTSVCIRTQPCPPCWQWHSLGASLVPKAILPPRSSTQAAQEELRKFLGKQRALEVNFSSKSLRGCGMWELWAFRSGNTLGYQQGLLWVHPRMVPGPSRTFQSTSGVNPV